MVGCVVGAAGHCSSNAPSLLEKPSRARTKAGAVVRRRDSCPLTPSRASKYLAQKLGLSPAEVEERWALMSVRWKKCLWQEPLPATPRDIARLEQAWGVVLPEAYKQVIATHQGMVPIPSTFRVGRGSDSVGPLLTLSPDPRWGNMYSALGIHEQLSGDRNF